MGKEFFVVPRFWHNWFFSIGVKHLLFSPWFSKQSLQRKKEIGGAFVCWVFFLHSWISVGLCHGFLFDHLGVLTRMEHGASFSTSRWAGLVCNIGSLAYYFQRAMGFRQTAGKSFVDFMHSIDAGFV
ncbi:unnamed protein product [Prunus brigantina]